MPRSRRSSPPFACGFALIRRYALRRQRGKFRHERARLVEQLLGPVAPQPVLEEREVLRVRRGPRPSGPGASGRCPRSGGRRPPSGRSSPSASEGRSSARSAGRSRRPSRASRWIVAISSMTWSIVRAIAWCISAGSSPSTKYGRVAVALEQRDELVVRDPREDRRVGDLVAVQVEDRQDGAVVHRVEELVGVPARREWVRSRPRRRRRRSRRAGPGCRTRRRTRARARSPSSPPSWIEPGRLGRDVARDAARERELAEQLAASPPRRAVMLG